MWGFQFLLILDLWGISFHAVIVFGLGNNLLFKSVLGHCDSMRNDYSQFLSQTIAVFVSHRWKLKNQTEASKLR